MKYQILWLLPVMLAMALFSGTAAAGFKEPGNFYAGDGALHEYDSAGNVLRTFAGASGVTDVVISPKTLNLFASDPLNNRLFNVDTETNTVSTVANFLFNQPTDLAFAKNNRLYVTNKGSGTVLEVLAEVSGLPTLVLRSNIGAGALTNPTGLAFNEAGEMFVSTGTNGVAVFDTTFNYTSTLTLAGLSNPGGIDFGADGRMYVVSKGTGEVLEVDPLTGSVLRVFGDETSSPLSSPTTVSVSAAENSLLIADSDNGIVKYDLASGDYLETMVGAGMSGVAAIVPEPASLMLVSIGLGALAYRRRRK